MIREKVEKLCKKNNMSIKALENKCGFGNGTIYKWDKSKPNTDSLIKVSEYFKVSLDYFLKD